MQLSFVRRYGNRVRLGALVVPWILAGAAAVQAAPPVTGTTPADPQMWVTMDAGELELLRAEAQGEALDRMPEVIEIHDGVAAAVTRESALADLAAAAHERFQRCASFAAHSSREEAMHWLYSSPAPALAAVDYTIDKPAEVTAVIDQVNASNIAATIRRLSSFPTRFFQSQSGQDAALWLKSQWESMAAGRPDVRVELFDHAAWLQDSVIATIQGSTFPDEVIVIGGHLDSIRSRQPASCTTACTAASCPSECRAPGANDDASGIASLTETFRAMMAAGFSPARTIKLMAYAAEEVGLRGSKEIAAAMNPRTGVNVIGMLQLDMTDFKNPRPGSVDVGIIADTRFVNAGQNAFVLRLLQTYFPSLTVDTTSVCGFACSDHASWTIEAGVPASFAFEARFREQAPNSHTINDTLENVDATGANAAKFSRLAAAYLVELAKGAIAPRR
jgi:leucyl aminopeptidase